MVRLLIIHSVLIFLSLSYPSVNWYEWVLSLEVLRWDDDFSWFGLSGPCWLLGLISGWCHRAHRGEGGSRVFGYPDNHYSQQTWTVYLSSAD
jgi:hypothetical protein